MPDTDALVSARVLAGMWPNYGRSRRRPARQAGRVRAASGRHRPARHHRVLAATRLRCAAARGAHRFVDPRNGNFWIIARHDASKRTDEVRIDMVLARIAQNTSLDLQFASPGWRLRVALKRIPPAPGMATHQSMWRSWCKRETWPWPSRCHRCRIWLRRANLARRPAVPVANPAAPSPGRGVTATRRSPTQSGCGCRNGPPAMPQTATLPLAAPRRLQWKMRQLAAVSVNSTVSPANDAGTMLAHQSEVDGIDALIRATGRPLDPPADWQPARPEPATAARPLS